MNEVKTDPIGPDQQAADNISWFAVDSLGHIGAFESCGFAWIHPEVLRSESTRRAILEFFQKRPADRSVKKHVEQFERLNVDDTPGHYLESASRFAKRGVFVFDVPNSPDRLSTFIRIVDPIEPLHISELPTAIRELLEPIRLDTRFSEQMELASPDH